MYRVGESNSAPYAGDFSGIDFHQIRIELLERTGFFGDDFGHCFDHRFVVVKVQNPRTREEKI